MIEELKNITLDDFVKYINAVRNSDITTLAPFGFSGDDLIIYKRNNPAVSRCCQLSFRKYCDSCEMLITDEEGAFLTYSKLNFCFDDEFIATYFYYLFVCLRPYMDKAVGVPHIDLSKAEPTIGFEILSKWEKEQEDGSN